ncbi:tRNA uracil 4-sulfurtransferase ThiI [Caldisalinibacter kiritimatiensis]|uniref:Probable tRNA sulfurtransferase n=1 Tax=Caldisalinibacter kiritimatiensis TaxID=1304284 RepID=R1CMK4_9FIRM|nr:tRNA uracil 4-sulfurtransferase ThiI [Caldisalinibacter kiritimatiensis]EOC99930.1 Thiamine biosynthesis protein thiI [Caldisalinibacter kiritimatiensis]
MDRVISISLGELTLKGKNRSYFEKSVVKHIKNAVKDLGAPKVYKDLGKVFVEVNENNIETLIKRLKKVFGIVLISPCIRTDKDIEEIKKASIAAVKEAMEKNNVSTFKVQTKRADKKFPIKSMEINRQIGGTILRNFESLKVDVHDPNLYVNVDIRNKCYIYTDKIRTYGGLPVGTNGKGLLLLSGGIDSPVAGFMIAKRGVAIDAVYYHSYPFTSERADEKVKELAKILSRYCGKIRLHSINILNIQREINQKCPEDELTIITRRFMMRIAERIANQNGHDVLITGESLGQVASQTIKSINVTNSSVNIPILRPLIGMDKTQIIEISKDIETYETSILPYEDCCTVFLPKHPVTKPKIKDIEESELALNVGELIEFAINNMEIIEIEP